MKPFLRILVCMCCLLFFAQLAKATWSIIVIDMKTGKIGIAGASCSQGVYGIGVTIPGKGAIVVQAASNSNARFKGYEIMKSGANAQAVLQAMMHPEYDPENQQYAVICMNDPDHAATYTGRKAPDSKGAITGKGISVQGNTLVTEQELQDVYDAALKAQKENRPIEEVLMLALEAGARSGGDKRCGERKASSAFLTVYQSTDTIQRPWLNLIVSGDDAAPDKHAVELLRQKFSEWKR